MGVGGQNKTPTNKKSDKFSPTILWEMAQSPHCGPAAVDRSSPRAQDNSRPIIFFLFLHNYAALSHLHNPALGLPLASQLAHHIRPPSRLPLLWCSALLYTWRTNVGRKEETTKKKHLCV